MDTSTDKLKSIFESDLNVSLSYSEAEEIGETLITLYEILAEGLQDESGREHGSYIS